MATVVQPDSAYSSWDWSSRDFDLSFSRWCLGLSFFDCETRFGVCRFKGYLSECTAITGGCNESQYWYQVDSDSDVSSNETTQHLIWKKNETIGRRKQTQESKTVLEDKFCELENGIFCRGFKKLLHDLVINTRSTALKICLIQGLISAWFGLWDKRKTGILENENCHYFQC